MANGTQTPSTVDANESKAATAIAGFFINHATSLVLTLIVGSGATYSLLELHGKSDEIHKQVKDAMTEVEYIQQDLEKHVNERKIALEVIPRLGNLEQDISEVKRLIGKIDNVTLNVETIKEQAKEISDGAKDHRKALQESIKEHVEIVQQSVNEKIELRTERIEDNQEFYRDDIIDQIQALPGMLNSVHHAFIGMFDRLVREGILTIRDSENSGDSGTEALDEWMLQANYVVRSLSIPSEDGIFLNRSLVEQDLRAAISKYNQAKDQNDKDGQIQHAKSTLGIVKAVRELAASGRIE